MQITDQNLLVNHAKYGGSAPRAFSPGLSSIGAAGFIAMNSGGQIPDGAMGSIGVMNPQQNDEEEKKMGNTFGSIQALMDKQPDSAILHYPLSEDEMAALPNSTNNAAAGIGIYY